MDVSLVTQLIRIGRDRLSERGLRSAEKEVSPLSWFTRLSCAEVTEHMERSFEAAFRARRSALSDAEVERARRLVASKYATQAWIERLP
jgi:lipoate-protein ligase A